MLKCLDLETENTNDYWGSIIIYGHQKCMNTCLFCSGKNESIDDDTIKYKKAIYDADYLISSGVNKIEISGGDPGEFSMIVDVVSYLKTKGIKTIQLSTHGRTLINENFVKKLKDAGVTLFKIPLYGSTQEIHNKSVQVDNSIDNAFSDTITGIKNCNKHGMSIIGYILLNQYNKNDITNIVRLYLSISNYIYKIIIGITFISTVEYSYTRDWFLPIKDMKPYLEDILIEFSKNNINFEMIDIPYCAIGKYSENIDNRLIFPNLGNHKVEEQNRSTISDFIPHYRIKSYFNECNSCNLKNLCSGIPINEIKMFGIYGLEGVGSV